MTAQLRTEPTIASLMGRLRPRIGIARIARRPSGSFQVLGLALGVGLLVGLVVVAVKLLVVVLQSRILGFDAEHTLGQVDVLTALRIVAALCCSGMTIVVVTALAERRDRRRGLPEPIDVVEANALRGGRLQSRDGISVAGPILTSVSCGASVGIEAVVTQIGGVIASLVGQSRRLPRSELRLLVGAGAAAAIAAAYDAPMAGMLYAFELVLGEYSTGMLAPVGLAAVAGTVLSHALLGEGASVAAPAIAPIAWPAYPAAAVLGTLCAVLGTTTMLLSSGLERLSRSFVPHPVARFLVGAACLGVLAYIEPGILGSGHAGLFATVHGQVLGNAVFLFLVAKILASAISLGIGYRGGLFSASLLIGALTGQGFASLLGLAGLPVVMGPNLAVAVGMASVGATIIGSPLAMIFLVLETTGSVEATIVVAVGAAFASFLTGRFFGYSFATWRFQQRGLALDGGKDVSHLSAVPIAALVRPPKRYVQADADFETVLRAVSAAGSRGTAVLAANGDFIGLIDPDLVELVEPDGALPVVALDLIYATAASVTPDVSLAAVLDLFRADDRATLAVLDARDSRELAGCIRARDAFALASQRADAQVRADLGVRTIRPT